jgi:hypothetical protein
MVSKVLSDTKRERIKDYLPDKAGDYGVTAKDNRRFVEPVLWIADICIIQNDGFSPVRLIAIKSYFEFHSFILLR